MATVKSYTDLQQSKKLAEILPFDSADFMWEYEPDKETYLDKPTMIPIDSYIFVNDIPCWSLASLLEAMPKIHGLKPILDLEECSIQYSGIDLYVVASNPVDACYEIILKLNELNLL